MKRDDLTPVWKALADPTRRRMLDLLGERPRTTGDLSARLGHLSRFAVMKHLGVLEAAGLLLVRRQGRERWNHLNVVPLQRIYERWMSPYQARWAGRLVQLKQAAEGPRGGQVMPVKDAVMPEGLATLVIEQEVPVAAPPSRVFDALTRDLAAWWGAPYLLAPEAATDIILEPTPGGRLLERWGEGQGAVWATVTQVRRDEKLELTGSLAMSGPVLGVVSFELAPDGAGTIVRLSHRAMGPVTPELRASYDGGWRDLLATRLKAFLETGARHGLRKERGGA